MSKIDLGNSPVESPPTEEEKAQIRNVLSDAYESWITGSDNTGNTGQHNSISGSFNLDNSGQNCVISGDSNIFNAGNNVLICGNGNGSNSGFSCVISGFGNSSNSGYYCIINGNNNTANSGYNCLILGSNNSDNSGSDNIIVGSANSGNVGSYCSINGGGNSSNSGEYCLISGSSASNNTLSYSQVHGGGEDARFISLVAKRYTESATPAILTLGGDTPSSSNRISIPTNTAWLFTANIICSDSTRANAKIFTRRGLIRNDAGSTSISSVETIGTDSVIGTLATSVSITADNTNDALNIEVTGVALTSIDWAARVDVVQVG